MAKRDMECRFFVSGSCTRGDRCSFLHTVSEQRDYVCQFNLVGNCSFGQTCRFKHISPETPLPANTLSSNEMSRGSSQITSSLRNSVSTVPFKFNVNAQEFTPSWKKTDNSIHSTSNLMGASSSEIGSSSSSNLAQVQKPDLKAKKIVCGICHDIIPTGENSFGILSGCDHSFCFGCIREWRSSHKTNPDVSKETTRTCPECRQHSDYVVASNFWVEGKEKRQALMDSVKLVEDSMNDVVSEVDSRDEVEDHEEDENSEESEDSDESEDYGEYEGYESDASLLREIEALNDITDDSDTLSAIQSLLREIRQANPNLFNL